jgi:hypothetical protein
MNKKIRINHKIMKINTLKLTKESIMDVFFINKKVQLIQLDFY